MRSNYLWYACYGSNLNHERFACFIQGGTPKYSKHENRGCRDKELPKKTGSIIIPYELYFAKNSDHWGGSAVAFVGLEKNDNHRTLGKLYLITENQFIDLLVQENGRSYEKRIDEKPLIISFGDIIQKGGQIIWDKPWYGNVLYLGCDSENIHIFTVTSAKEELSFSSPNEQYLYHIVKGLKENPYNLSNEQTVQYLSTKKGIIDTRIEKNDLIRIVETCK